MTTPLDLITDAVEKLGVYAPGETLSSADSARGLQMLSDLIDEWLDDSIQLFELNALTFDIQIGQQYYTVGINGNCYTPQCPTRVVIGPGIASVTSGTNTTPVDSVSQIEWNAIYNTGTPSSGTPSIMFYLPTFPLGLLGVTPIPNATGSMTFPGYYPLPGAFTDDLTSMDLTLAPGEQLALSSNLAVNLHAYFAVTPIMPDLNAMAQQSKTLLTLTNRLSRAMSIRNVAPPTPATPRP